MLGFINNKIKIITAIFFMLFVFVTLSSNAQAAPVVGFNAGNIIDDLVFTYSQSMNVQQIQTFLNSKVPVCDTGHTGFYGSSGTWYGPPFTCLRSYTENGKSSAQIIYDAAQTYSINPQVLIVLLQKEQALITDTWPASYQYKTATGYGCPDGADCNASYFGFTNQVTWAARMFRSILNNSPTWYTPYELGNNYIQYNPNTSCGGSVVNIQNRSTQALYNYTPYQPNQSSLNAGYGTGDGCGAYGNRNFYLYFTDWFGPTRRSLIRTSDGGVYLVENGVKRPFPSSEIFFSYSYKWSDILIISPTELSLIPMGTPMVYNTHYRDTKLVSSTKDDVWLIENGAKRSFPSSEVFLSNSYKWSDIMIITTSELALIPSGAQMIYNIHYRDTKLVSSDRNGVYSIENGTKRSFPDANTFTALNYKWSDILIISPTELSLIPMGTPMVPR